MHLGLRCISVSQIHSGTTVLDPKVVGTYIFATESFFRYFQQRLIFQTNFDMFSITVISGQETGKHNADLRSR